MRVFISHPIDDEDLAMRLKKILEESPEIEEAYIAQKIKEYEIEVSKKITKQINKSDYVVALITKKAKSSASVNQELGFAQGVDVLKIPMIEKKAKRGVLIYGKDSEEFTRDNFDEVCKTVREHIIQHGPRQKSTDLSEEEKEGVFNNIGSSVPPVYRAFRRMTIIPSSNVFEKFIFDNDFVNWLRPPQMFKIDNEKLMQNEFHYIGSEGPNGHIRYGVINEEGMICFQEVLHYDRTVEVEREMIFLLTTLNFAEKFYNKIGYKNTISLKYQHASVQNFQFGHAEESLKNFMDISHTVQKSDIHIYRDEQITSLNKVTLANSILEEFSRACDWSPPQNAFISILNLYQGQYFPKPSNKA